MCLHPQAQCPWWWGCSGGTACPLEWSDGFVRCIWALSGAHPCSALLQDSGSCYKLVLSSGKVTVFYLKWVSNHSYFEIVKRWKQWGTEENQSMPELWRFERGKGGWECPKTEVRKGNEKLPPLLSHFCALGFPFLVVKKVLPSGMVK